MNNSVWIESFSSKKDACQMISPFLINLLYLIDLERFCWKKFMCQSRLLPYEYFTDHYFLLGCILRLKIDFFLRPKLMACPVSRSILNSMLLFTRMSSWISARLLIFEQASSWTVIKDYVYDNLRVWVLVYFQFF